MSRRLAVAIPTCSQHGEDIRVGYVLQALAMQGSTCLCDGYDIFIWDEGSAPITGDRWVRLILDLLLSKGHSSFYLRRGPSRGVAEARRQLLASVPLGYDRILMLDDDLIPMPGAIEAILDAANAVERFGFIQGSKIELDPNRVYANDINQLTTASGSHGLQPLWFGDAAFLLVDRRALEHVRWDRVARFTEEHLPGEDVAMTLMIADREPCFGLAAAEGYHMSLHKPRWRWDVPSDLLQMEILRDIISPETLRRAMPHLAKYVDKETLVRADVTE